MAMRSDEDRARRRAFGLGVWSVLCLGVMVSQLSGCGGTDGREPTYPVQGSIRFHGEPASGAFAVFHRDGPPVTQGPAQPDGTAAEPIRPSAQINPDGSFLVTTFRGGDGAPAGDYRVTVQWHKSVLQDGVPVAGPNVLPPEYGDPKTTPLKVTVKPEANTVEPWSIQ